MIQNKSLPPPLPSGPSQHDATPSSRGADATYDLLADKIGGVPNVRKKDNLYQAATVAVFLIIGVMIGSSQGGWPEGVLLGALGGLVAGTLISGLVIMVLGLRRKSFRRSGADLNQLRHPDLEPPRVQAWMALAFPVLAWVSQGFVPVFVRRAPPEVYLLVCLLAAGLQALLLFGALFLGIWALAKRGRGGVAVIVPATIGMLMSAVTLLLGFLMVVKEVFR